MIKLSRREALWIIRGIRLGKFLRCCVRTARRFLLRAERPVDTAEAGKAAPAEQAPVKPSAPPVEVMKVIQSAPARTRPPQAACKGKRGRKPVPVDRLPPARARAGGSRLDH